MINLHVSHMNKNLIGIFLALHGIVFALYGIFDIYPALDQNLSTYTPVMGWAGPSWVFSSFINDNSIIIAALMTYLLSSVLFVLSGVVFVTDSDWWRISILTAVLFSTFTLILFWDGSFQHIINKGIIGLVLNIVIGILVYQK